MFQTPALCHIFTMSHWHEVTMSLTFYKHLFCTKMFCVAFLNLQFGSVIFWCKNIGTKGAHKMLMKLTAMVNFINVLHAAFLRKCCVQLFSTYSFGFVIFGQKNIGAKTDYRTGVSQFHVHLQAAFLYKMFCAAFIYILFGFVIFWWKNIGAKAAHKILVKFTTVVNFTNVLQAAFFRKCCVQLFSTYSLLCYCLSKEYWSKSCS